MGRWNSDSTSKHNISDKTTQLAALVTSVSSKEDEAAGLNGVQKEKKVHSMFMSLFFLTLLQKAENDKKAGEDIRNVSIRKRKPSQSDDTDRENTSSHRHVRKKPRRHDIRRRAFEEQIENTYYGGRYRKD
jgi:hypothetical protein